MPLNELQLRRIYLLRALEQLDEQRILFDDSYFKNVNPKPAKSEDALLSQLFEGMEQRLNTSQDLQLSNYYLPRSHAPLLLSLCCLLGLSSNYLGSGTRIDLLANPLVMLLLWNLGIFVLLIVRVLMKRPALTTQIPTMAAQLLHKLVSLSHLSDTVRLLHRARLAMRLRVHTTYPLLTNAKITCLLHSGAACLVLGVLAGLYLRGLAQGYTFYWDSTFLPDEASRLALLKILLAPVLLLLNTIFGLAEPQLSGANGAYWIHILSATATLYVLIPRLFLALYWYVQARRLARNMTFRRDAYLLDLLARKNSLEARLTLVGYSFKLNEDRRRCLLDAARLIWGQQTDLLAYQDIQWGEDLLAFQLSPDHKNVIFVCFNASQTPEEEVHTNFAKSLTRALIGFESPVQVLMVLDVQRLSADRTPHRQKAWQQVLGMTHLFWVDLAQDAKTVAAQLADALEQGTPS